MAYGSGIRCESAKNNNGEKVFLVCQDLIDRAVDAQGIESKNPRRLIECFQPRKHKQMTDDIFG